MAFSSLVLQVTLSGAKREATTEEETERKDKGRKETELWLAGCWPYHTYMLAFLYSAFQKGWVTEA